MRIKNQPELLDSAAAAEFLGLASPGVLAVWRSTKRYPLPYLKMGRKVFYDVEDLLAFIESRKICRTEVVST